MERTITSIVLLVVLMAACAPVQHNPSYQEDLAGGFDLKEWSVGNHASDKNQRVVEFVRPGEKIDNWTELFTLQTLRKPANPDPVDVFVARALAVISKECPDLMQNIIAHGLPTETEEASIVYEWSITKCPSHADQHEVARILYGKFNIFRLAYVAKTGNLAPEKREQWIKALEGARIMVSKN